MEFEDQQNEFQKTVKDLEKFHTGLHAEKVGQNVSVSILFFIFVNVLIIVNSILPFNRTKIFKRRYKKSKKQSRNKMSPSNSSNLRKKR